MKKRACDAEIITKLADIKYFYIRSWGDSVESVQGG